MMFIIVFIVLCLKENDESKEGSNATDNEETRDGSNAFDESQSSSSESERYNLFDIPKIFERFSL